MRTTCKHWRSEELALLKKLYTTTSYTHKQMAEILTKRTRQAITHKLYEIYKTER